MIKSYSFDQNEILADIMALHTGPIEVDATYGSGCFYKKIPKPPLCFDLAPRKPGVIAADVCALPLPGGSVGSIMFDPPFLIQTGPGSIIKDRFGSVVGCMGDLWEFYRRAMVEMHRALARGGWMVFKCQDGVLSGKNHFTHVDICRKAEAIGFVAVDLFLLLATHRMTSTRQRVQRHARKFHSYFWVFQK